MSTSATPQTPASTPGSGPSSTPGSGPSSTPGSGPRPQSLLRRALHQRRFVVGAGITAFVVLVAVVGPWLAPPGQNDIVGNPFAAAGGLLGTDYLGQDVLSRVLSGGRSILVISLLTTPLGMLLGIAIGLLGIIAFIVLIASTADATYGALAHAAA